MRIDVIVEDLQGKTIGLGDWDPEKRTLVTVIWQNGRPKGEQVRIVSSRTRSLLGRVTIK